MPPGSRKRKASKRKSVVQNLNPLPIPSAEENGKRLMLGEEEEGDEKFQTPRFYPDPIDLPAESLMSQKKGGIQAKVKSFFVKAEKPKVESSSKDGESDTSGKLPAIGEGDMDETANSAVADVAGLEETPEASIEPEVNGNRGLGSEKGDDVDGDESLESGFPSFQSSGKETVSTTDDEDLEGKEAEVSVFVKGNEVGNGSSNLANEKQVKEVNGRKEFYRDAAEVETDQGSEVARGALVVHRATIWNCCGLLDLLNSSDKKDL